MESKYNLKSPAVKRLMKEAAELRDPTQHYHAQPLEDNLFEWHFSVRGPPDSDFDGGVYHGRIVLPPEYPMKPPSIILLTANGRFEVGKKICLSISGHHPETWQPSWSIRTALIAIIGFMPTKGEGAIGSLDYTPGERKALAKKSQDFCCESCGSCMRTALLALSPDSDPRPVDPQALRLAQQISFKAESSSSAADRGSSAAAAVAVAAAAAALSDSESSSTPERDTEDTSSTEQTESSFVAAPTSSEGPSAPAAPSPRQRRSQTQSPRYPTFTASPAPPHPQQDPSHTGCAVLIVLLTLALAALIFRRIYLAHEYKFDYEL
ncbi:ubiquitin-conjugating enzyme E2 J1-like [Pimephales promelas]|uniref:ubiquitin-conjugating enzyme E2 J1-like n=1 Tax=Pimephales promelas TaxID=90988 RepID=UPI0019555BD0|nr:ubiquitin-conjugating enzyme E2 J1-like [Pimephales promelas]XP_039520245.1 ubiquitin-conjugating enzyme E2 J1-like [Pimephales promelas]KAG1929555.1 UBIQUITIN CONJUGAT 2 domain-containing protein [Pimephales promelas]